MSISEPWLKTGHADMIGSSASHRPALLRCPSVGPAVLTGPACNYSSSGDGHAALRATAQRQGCYRVSWPTTYWLPVARTRSSAGATVSMTSSHGCLPWVTHRCLCCPFPSQARVCQWTLLFPRTTDASYKTASVSSSFHVHFNTQIPLTCPYPTLHCQRRQVTHISFCPLRHYLSFLWKFCLATGGGHFSLSDTPLVGI